MENQTKNQQKIESKINKKSNQNSRRNCYHRCHGSLGRVFTTAMRDWRFGPLFVAVLQLIFAASSDGKGFGAFGPGQSSRWTLAIADCERKRVLELERRLGYGEERVLFWKMRKIERKRDCVWWILWVVGSR